MMQTINLTQNNFKMPPVVYMVQNDTGRSLKMILDDVTLAGTETGAVAIRRSDGSYYTIAAIIDATNNAFDADMTQALTQPSRTECQLKVTRSGLVVSSYTFIIMVQPSTDGINEAQLGYSVQQLRQDAEDIKTGGMPLDLRLALLQIAEKVAYIDDQGQQYYQDLYDALMPSVELVSISAVYTQSGAVYEDTPLDDLKDDLVVTATYADSTTAVILASDYSLTGALTFGTSTVTVNYGGETDTFTVSVSWEGVTYTAFRDCNSAWSGSDGIDTKLETTSNSARASTDPLAFVLKPGTYEISCPTAYYFGPHLTAVADASPAFSSVNWSNSGTIKTFWSGTATRLLSAGWQNGTYTMTVTEDALFSLNFKKGSAGTQSFSASDLANLLSGVTITRTA